MHSTKVGPPDDAALLQFTTQPNKIKLIEEEMEKGRTIFLLVKRIIKLAKIFMLRREARSNYAQI